MDSLWVSSAAGLPFEGQPIEFVLDGRDVAMDGIYGLGTFQSRWSGYAVERVHSWRSVDLSTGGRHDQPSRYRAKSGDLELVA